MNPLHPRNTRQHDRYAFHPPAVATTDALGEVIVVDLSLAGARIRHRTPAANGARVMMKARMDRRGVPLTFHGAVAWTRIEIAGDDPVWESGIAFDAPVDELRPVIEKLFATRALELSPSRYA